MRLTDVGLIKRLELARLEQVAQTLEKEKWDVNVQRRLGKISLVQRGSNVSSETVDRDKADTMHALRCKKQEALYRRTVWDETNITIRPRDRVFWLLSRFTYKLRKPSASRALFHIKGIFVSLRLFYTLCLAQQISLPF